MRQVGLRPEALMVNGTLAELQSIDKSTKVANHSTTRRQSTVAPYEVRLCVLDHYIKWYERVVNQPNRRHWHNGWAQTSRPGDLPRGRDWPRRKHVVLRMCISASLRLLQRF